jgi:hypothetical protein
MLTELQNRKIVVPQWVEALAEALMFYVKHTDEYMQGTIRTPPSYFYPFGSDMKVSEVNTLLAAVIGENMECKIFCDKYGLKYKYLNQEMLTKEIREIDGFLNKEWLGFASQASFDIYDNASAHTIQPDGTFVVDDEEHKTRKCYFIEDPNESIWPIAASLLQGYDVDHNKYGYLNVSNDTLQGDDDDDCSFAKIDFVEVTAWTQGTITSMSHLFPLFASTFQQGAGHSSGDTSGFFNLSLTGSKLAADIDYSEWQLAKTMGAFYKDGWSKTIYDNALLNWCIDKAF